MPQTALHFPLHAFGGLCLAAAPVVWLCKSSIMIAFSTQLLSNAFQIASRSSGSVVSVLLVPMP